MIYVSSSHLWNKYDTIIHFNPQPNSNAAYLTAICIKIITVFTGKIAAPHPRLPSQSWGCVGLSRCRLPRKENKGIHLALYPIHTTAENAHRCALMRILEFAPFTLQPQCAAKRILCPSEAKRSEANSRIRLLYPNSRIRFASLRYLALVWKVPKRSEAHYDGESCQPLKQPGSNVCVQWVSDGSYI